MSDLLTELTRGSIHVVYSFGYVGVFVLVALSNLLLPIPSQLVLAFSGFLIDRGYFSFPMVLLTSTAASLVSALILYAPGHRLGEKPLHRFVRRFGRLAFVNESHLYKASAWFEQHDEKAVLIARLIPGVGSLISVPAGLNRMPLWRFLTYTTLGASLWNTMFIGLGWALGTWWRTVAQYAQPLGYVGLAIVVSGLFWFLWHRRRIHR
ncbi:MAG: DedA family protein [Rubrobacter sp.]|nr:DedA family protein [Rubrobacter sp.]